MDPQLHFDSLVAVAEAYYRARAWTPEELALKAVIDGAKQLDPGVAAAAEAVAWSKLAPPGLAWNARGVEG